MDDPSIIYKFRTWNNLFHQNVLRQNQLFYASPADINDPFDFKINIDFSLLDSGIKREKYVDHLIAQTLNTLIQRGINPAQKRDELLWRLLYDRDKMQDEYNQTENEWSNNRLGVISFSLKWNSILLWSHYAENHKGFCIGFNKQKIEDSGLFGSTGPVNYLNVFPSLDPLGTDPTFEIVTKSHSKAFEWNYEKEYRLTQIWPETNPTINERTINVPNDYFEEIILGLNISKDHEKEIIEIAREKKFKIFKSVRRRNAFALDRVKC